MDFGYRLGDLSRDVAVGPALALVVVGDAVASKRSWVSLTVVDYGPVAKELRAAVDGGRLEWGFLSLGGMVRYAEHHT